MPRLGGLLAEGLRGTFADRKGLLAYGIPTTLLLTGVWCFVDLGHLNWLFGTMCLVPALAYVSFYWQRRYLMGAGSEFVSGENIHNLTVDYGGRAILFIALFAVLGVPVWIRVAAPLYEAGNMDGAVGFAGLRLRSPDGLARGVEIGSRMGALARSRRQSDMPPRACCLNPGLIPSDL